MRLRNRTKWKTKIFYWLMLEGMVLLNCSVIHRYMALKNLTQTVLKIHGLFCQNIEPGYAGRCRDVRVLITGSQYPVAAPEKIQREMDCLFAWVQKEREGYHPVEFAAQLHKRFVFIHPFKDGNGRVARLLMNLALIQDGYLPVVVPPILRGDYVSLLERAHRDDREFMEFIAEREFESQKEILRLFEIPFPKEGQEQKGEGTVSRLIVET